MHSTVSQAKAFWSNLPQQQHQPHQVITPTPTIRPRASNSFSNGSPLSPTNVRPVTLPLSPPAIAARAPAASMSPPTSTIPPASPAPSTFSITSTTTNATLTSDRKPPKKPTKRIRIATACISCRQKKIRCDGQQPCAHCERVKTTCTYPVASKPANQEYVETLENRLRSVESHLQGLLARGWGKTSGTENEVHELSDDNTDMSSPYTPATPPQDGTSAIYPKHSGSLIRQYILTKQFSGTSNSSSRGRRHSNASCDAGIDSGSESSGAADDSMDILGFLMGDLKVDRDGAAQYIPRVQDTQEKSYGDTRVYTADASLSPASAKASHANPDWDRETPRAFMLPQALLPPHAIAALLDIYFNSVHTFLPVLHKPSFMTLCADGNFCVPPFLLMCICAVAARHATEAELSEIPELANLQHHALYDHARTLLDTYIDVPRLSTVQGLLLLAFYQTKEKRPGHFFRIRMYLNQATRMALDMGYPRTLRQLKDSPLSRNGTGQSTISKVGDAPPKDTPEKRAILHLECRLAWLGCYFLDGLSSSIMGQDYCVQGVTPDTRQLIKEANLLIDTVQGATLVFWYHHLELISICRRVCEFYRSVHKTRQLGAIRTHPMLLEINAAQENWLSSLPAHLVLVDNTLPSYYTLYLHRFYYSHRLLLYRPFLTSRQLRGVVDDVASPLSISSQAACKLTLIGETIFQNYSWPWPGCGLFAYHMLQAIEVHLFLMVTHSSDEAQQFYHRTLELLKGYLSLAKLPSLEKDVAAMEEMVSKVVFASQQQQQQVLGDSLHPSAQPLPQLTLNTRQGPVLGSFPASSVVDQQNSMMTPTGEDSIMFSPSMSANVYTPGLFQTAAAANGFAAGLDSIDGVYDPTSSMSFAMTTTSTPNTIVPQALLPSNTSSYSLAFNQSQALHPSGVHANNLSVPMGDLLGLGSLSSFGASSNNMGAAPITSSMASTTLNTGSSHSIPPPTSSSSSFGMVAAPASNSHKKNVVPPPKPAKRLLPQSTGSSSSTITQGGSANAPPVPRKPASLKSDGGSTTSSKASTVSTGPRWIAPRPMGQPITIYQQQQQQQQQAYQQQHQSGASSTATMGNGNGQPVFLMQPNSGSTRPLPKVLPAQPKLYGMGPMVNTIGVEPNKQPLPEEPAVIPGTWDRSAYVPMDPNTDYMQVGEQYYDPTPQQRRQVI
ncbi:hypothetical protein BGZ73_000031 [Actinomortierella ambigua]|nr:hypothetical protein BGZ73_000031 [Actinomortierella ambigua]